jgi:O-antigen/teichoic acid export membrane protein
MGVPFTQYLLSARQSWLMSWSSIVASVGSMVLVAMATWWFGVMGATAAAVSGVFMLHLTRYGLALRLGCAYRLEPGLLWGVGVILAVYGFTRWIATPMPVKVALAALAIGVVVKRITSRGSLRDVLTAVVPSK